VDWKIFEEKLFLDKAAGCLLSAQMGITGDYF
jgi:hypothetical protein